MDSELAPIFEALGSSFFAPVCCFIGALRARKVTGFWSWADWLAQQAREFGRQPLLLNLDETAISRAHPGSPGWIVSKSWWPGALRPHQKIPKKDERSMITHVGLITHNTTVQGRLPQILIGNERIFTPELMAAVAQVAPSKVQFWRCKSSWNTSNHMLRILREIALAMAEFPEFQPILVMDCATIHLSPRVLNVASTLGIWILPVPAGCTFLLQPCDTHVFAALKAFLKRAYRDSKDANGVVTSEAWARTVIDAVTVFLCGRSWTTAFQQTGIIGDRQRLTRDVAALQATPPVSPSTRPTLATVRDLLPRNRRVPYSQLLAEPRGQPVRVLFR